jgi:tRNA/rRNA methyltransferase
MSNFGFVDLRLVNPYGVAFREAKSAVGAAVVLEHAREFASVAEAVAGCTLVVGTTAATGRELEHAVRRLESGARLIGGHKGQTALLFGSEKFGLSNDDISHCHWLMQIPSRPEHRSMNLGQAVAVCLYELIRQSRPAAAPARNRKPATAGDAELLVERLHEMLHLSGYMESTATVGSRRRLRNLVTRLNLSSHDASVWLGIFRQTIWKLQNPSSR